MYCDTQCFCKSVLLHVLWFLMQNVNEIVYGGSAIHIKNNIIIISILWLVFGFVQINRLKHGQSTIHKSPKNTVQFFFPQQLTENKHAHNS